MLADDLEFPFIELSREVEKFAGCGGQQGRDGGFEAHPRGPRRVLFHGRLPGKHQRATAAGNLPDIARHGTGRAPGRGVSEIRAEIAL